MEIFFFKREENNDYSFIAYKKDVLGSEDLKKTKMWLDNISDLRSGKTSFNTDIPRLQKWYQNDGIYFSKDWRDQNNPRWIANKYDEFLHYLQQIIQEKLDNMKLDFDGYNHPKLNSCLVNKYRNGNDTIKEHKDNQSNFLENPTVLSLSLGEARTIIFRRTIYSKEYPNSIKKDKEKSDYNFKIELESGSLLIMAGAVQKYFSHQISKEDDKLLRYSCTFRQIFE